MRSISLLLLLPGALAGCAATTPDGAHRRAAVDRVPAATPVGAARTCIPIASIRESRVRSDRVIDFVMAGGQVYRTTLPNACPQLGSERRFAYETSLSQLCSTDIITVLFQAPVMRGASCGLAPFQPVRLAPR